VVLPAGQQPLPLLGDASHQRLEGFGEAGHAILLQLLGNGVQACPEPSRRTDAEFGQLGELSACLLQAGLDCERDGAVVEEGV